jgi:hypothetical protein
MGGNPTQVIVKMSFDYPSGCRNLSALAAEAEADKW